VDSAVRLEFNGYGRPEALKPCGFIMPIAITREDEQRRITVVVSDPWSVEEIAIAIDRQISEQTWRYGTLYDLRNSQWVPSEPDLLWLVKRGQQQVALHGARGPIAVLVGAASSASALQRYADYGGSHAHVLVRVFDDPDTAHAWLAAQTH